MNRVSTSLSTMEMPLGPQGGNGDARFIAVFKQEKGLKWFGKQNPGTLAYSTTCI